MMLIQAVYGLRLATSDPIPFLQLALADGLQPDCSVLFEEALTSSFQVAGVPWYQSQLPSPGRVPEMVGYCDPVHDTFYFHYQVGTTFTYKRRARQLTASWSKPQTFEDTCTYLIGPILGFLLQLQHRVCLHASVVALGRSTLAFVGPNGAGKSTLAAVLVERGAQLITEDVATIEPRGERFYVHLGPRAIRLWPPSVVALYGRPDALPRISEHWPKQYRLLDDYEPVEAAPLTAIYLLESASDEAALTSLPTSPGVAVGRLLANVYPSWLPLPEAQVAALDLLAQLAGALPVAQLRIPRNFSRLTEVGDYLLARHG
ncbi:hypothetical protein J8C06_03840 [Chloracidobacterium validum]|uniref:Hpr(Ser) kinase/phosphatase n=1 Tax=Chloracidobacterium validum TaxID=2821543 RepID=A0ABX8BC21_9BACT|nr:hypothetical protein [Chloracidobacterium validum]QUW03576.1 hypothetical protein J8C06_03840 [Chloracidobacterium validum]